MEEKEKILPEGAIIYLLENKFGIKVKKHANTYSCKCPFHDDKKPSALVSPQTNTFACTVCGSSLKKRWYELIGKEYIEEPQKYYYIPAKAVAMLKGITKRAMTEEEWKEFLKELKEKNFTPMENNTEEITKERIYPEAERVWKLSEKHICPKSIKYLYSRNIDGLMLYKKGLIRFLNNEKLKELEYFYKDGYRILIPFYDYKGEKIVGLQLRRFIKDNNKDKPKAKTLPGSTITDFGLEDLNPKGVATFFVEGSTDYLSLKSLGFKNVIGFTNINSTFNTQEKIELLNKLPPIIFMFYDKDKAGITFLERIKKQIKEINPEKILIPLNLLSEEKEIKDVNDFINKTENPKEIIMKEIKNTLEIIIKNKEKKEKILSNLEI